MNGLDLLGVDARVGDITDTKTDYDKGEQLVLAMNQMFIALGRPAQFEVIAEGIWKEYEDAKAGYWWTATDKFLNATKMKTAGQHAATFMEDLKRAFPEKMAGTTLPPPPAGSFFGVPSWVWWTGGGVAVAAGAVLVVPHVVAAVGSMSMLRRLSALRTRG